MCGVCGERGVTSLDARAVENLRSLFSGDEMETCADCMRALCKGRAPLFSRLSGFDWGVKPPHLLELSRLELAAISRTILFCSTIKITSKRGGNGGGIANPDFAHSWVGHFIAFASESPIAVATTLPRDDIRQFVTVLLVASAEQAKTVKEDPRRFLGSFVPQLSVRLDTVRMWLQYLKHHNPAYTDVHISEPAAAALENLGERLVVTAVVSSDGIDVCRDAARTENVATQQQREAGFDDVLLDQRPLASDDASENVFNVLTNQLRPQLMVDEPVIAVAARGEAINEFSNPEFRYRGAFPHLIFGECAGLKALTGPLPTPLVRKMLRFHDGRFGRNAAFVFYAWNTLARHSMYRSMALRLKAAPHQFERFLALTNNDEFRALLAKSVERGPDSIEARRVRLKILPYLYTAGGSSHSFSVLRRKAARAKFFAEVCYRGMPSVFFTLSPADMDCPAVLRLCTTPEGTLHRSRTALVQANPVAAAEGFNRLLESTIENLFRVELRKKLSTPGTVAVQRGVLGRPVAFAGVLESQGRLALHCHGLFWGGMPPTYLESIAHDASKCASAARFIDSIVRARDLFS